MLVFKLYQLLMSLSARRAWIEIIGLGGLISTHLVALRKESVDRNGRTDATRICWEWSLSARRAWIEIVEEVSGDTWQRGRSPQGERG